ncbi:MAG: hydroxymethylglutaryl-CoA synthase family protein [Calditrichaeota bacterium]|nr:hydroxymethylglutaryl-CoA synthase family protein [Calditrichota bacterium]
MVGISKYGVYLPVKRLKAEEMDRAAGGPGRGKGEKAVASFDEDSLTLGVNALYEAGVLNETSVDALFFASTTAPYLEKSSAALMAETLPLTSPQFTVDFSGTLRAASNALILGMHHIQANGARMALAAADTRLADVYSADERAVGDGAAALLLDSGTDHVAELTFATSTSQEILDVWRKPGDRFLKMTEPHFRLKFGFNNVITSLFRQFLKTSGVNPGTIHHIAVNAPNAKLLIGLLKQVNLEPAPLTLRLYQEIGHTGASFGLLNFLAELESAKVGETILWLDYGDGANALLFQKTGEAETPQIERAIGQKLYLKSYEDYLRLRNLVVSETPPMEPFTSAVMNFREKRQNYALVAQKCKTCGEVTYPHNRICRKCNAKDNFEYLPISLEGKIFTFTKEYLYPSPEGVAVTASADMDSGVRLFLQVTDSDYDKIEVGQRVRRTFRKLHDAGGFHNYFWKFRVIEG